MSITNIPETISATNGLNECANLFRWVISAISSLKSKWSGTQQENLQGDVQQLQSDLQCLSDTLLPMYNLIDRAEWKIHDPCVADLLPKLKDAVYDAEDFLDEFRWYDTKVTIDGSAISLEPIIKFFHSVTQGSFNKMADIQKRLNYLSGQLEKMGLLQELPRFDKSFRPETTAFPIEPEIFGHNKEKEKLIRMLGVPTDNNMGSSKHKRKRNVCSSTGNQICASIDDSNDATTMCVQVLPIVGIGGVGKTTLAQDICNNSKVRHRFKKIIWICVSDDFDIKRLTKEAIVQFSEEVPKDGNLNFLQGALAKRVKKKRFLLVLDDMWDENEQHWKQFCAPFRNVRQGSMMLVTTRSPKVADVVRTMNPFPLEGLDKDIFREFFNLCVFGSNGLHINVSKENNSNIDKLEQIGEKILPKLRGSPLAAKTLGRLLGMSLDPTHWDRILQSHLWELQQKETDILPALRLSYMYLPFHLKRCFSFCAIFPKDYNFEKEKLTEIWVAEGFVRHQPNVSLQHTGAQYFEELAHLSFFQKHPWALREYVMHDLIHDMAQLVSKDVCFVIKDTKDFPRIPQNVRHLWVLKDGDFNCSDLLNLCKQRKLRSLFCDLLSLKSETDNIVMEKWCNELLRMRVMVCSISKWGLPGSISNMKLLRYLEILNSSLCKRLPSAFYCLYNMQIFYAKIWEIDDISHDFGMMINMQKFESANCQFPPIYSVGSLIGATEQGQKSQFVLKNYNGDYLPSWFHPQNSKQIVTDVEIVNCRNFSNLEQFLQPAYVPIVKNIEIFNCRSLESVPTERFGDLRFLEVLRVSHCPKIKARHLFSPSLRKLYLEDSGNLGYKIECSSLTILCLLINNPFEFIKLQMWNIPLLQELRIFSCPYLTIIRDSEPISTGLFHGGVQSRRGKLPLLTDLIISSCEKLKTIDDLLYLPAVERISIVDCGLAVPVSS